MENRTRFYFDRNIFMYNIEQLKAYYCKIFKLNFYIITTVNDDKFIIQEDCVKFEKSEIIINTPYEEVVIFKNNVASIIKKFNGEREPRDFIFSLVEEIESRKEKSFRDILK